MISEEMKAIERELRERAARVAAEAGLEPGRVAFGIDVGALAAQHAPAPAPKPAPKQEQQTPQEQERGVKFAEWFRTLLPGHLALPGNWREKWARCYDELVRLDKRTPEEIARVALFLSTKDSSYLAGADVVADGGMGQV